MTSFADPFEDSSKSINSKLPSTTFVQTNWRKFLNAYPSVADCVEELYRLAYGHPIKCLPCGSKGIRKFSDSRIIVCQNCKRKSHTLAGTFFTDVRKPRAWLGALWFLEQGIEINSSEFARISGIVSSTAQEIFKRFTYLIINQMARLPETSSRAFVPVFNKRSRISPSILHPAAEQIEMEKRNQRLIQIEEAQSIESSEADSSTTETEDLSNKEQESTVEPGDKSLEEDLSSAEKTILSVLTSDSTHFDTIHTLTGIDTGILTGQLVILELKGLVKSADGNRFFLVSPSRIVSIDDLQLSDSIAPFVSFIRTTFQGISRKYLQNYLAWHWYIFDKERSKYVSLTKHRICFGCVTPSEIREYITPLNVKVSPLLV